MLLEPILGAYLWLREDDDETGERQVEGFEGPAKADHRLRKVENPPFPDDLPRDLVSLSLSLPNWVSKDTKWVWLVGKLPMSMYYSCISR